MEPDFLQHLKKAKSIVDKLKQHSIVCESKTKHLMTHLLYQFEIYIRDIESYKVRKGKEENEK